MTNKQTTLSKVLRYIRRYWVLLACSILLAAGTVALTLYVPILVGDAIDLIVGPGQVDFAGVRSLLAAIAVLVAVTAVMFLSLLLAVWPPS